MAYYANQKTLKIDKPEGLSSFAIYGKPAIGIACSQLNGSAFKVYCYLLSQKAQTYWNVSPRHAELEWGIARSTWADGMRELKEKGFVDEYAIHMIAVHDSNEIRNDCMDIVDDECENQYSNNINNSNNNNVVISTSADNSERKASKIVRSSEIDFLLKRRDWRKDVLDNDIWISPTDMTVKVIFDN